jgi:UPF0716 protein FxsA
VGGDGVIFRLGCLFILVPLVELAILIRIGQGIGLGPTLILVVATGLVGAFLARREGVRVLTAIQLDIAAGRLPARSLLDGAAVLIGGALLLTPGIVTDLAGLGLLLPVSRHLLSSWVQARMARALRRGTLRVGIWAPRGYTSSGPLPDAREDGVDGRSGEIVQE